MTSPSLSRDTLQFHPSEAREEFRKNNLSHIPCSEFCAGYLQANIACVPSNMADDFERLCINNFSPFPLLCRSQPGEVSVPSLALDSDVRTDLQMYTVSENGVITRHVNDVSDILWQDMVTFYFGCSFSFDFMLITAEVPLRHVTDKQVIPEYLSKIPLLSEGPFSGDMIVTMRAIPREFVQKAVEVCVPLEFAHGAPIHIGAPSIIGIDDLRPGFGDEPNVGENDVLAFWGCGVSGIEAITSAKPSIAVSLSFGSGASLFITDQKVMDYYKKHPPQHAHLSPKVIFLSESPQFASLVSQEAIDQMYKNENDIISHKHAESTNVCKESGDYLLKSAMTLSHASSVAIVTRPQQEVSEQQFVAVICIAKALIAQGKQISVLATESNATVWKKFLDKCKAENVLSECIPVVSVALAADDWSHDVCTAIPVLVDYLGSSFRSTSLNSMIIVNAQGNLFIGNLLCFCENLNGDMSSNGDHVIKNYQPIERDRWLNPKAVAMAAYILSTCLIHSRYVRRGRGQHMVKTENEFIVTQKQMASLGFN